MFKCCNSHYHSHYYYYYLNCYCNCYCYSLRCCYRFRWEYYCGCLIVSIEMMMTKMMMINFVIAIVLSYVGTSVLLLVLSVE